MRRRRGCGVDGVDRVAQEAVEGRVLDELLVEVHIVLEEDLHDLAEGLFVDHAVRVGRVGLGVLPGGGFWNNFGATLGRVL